jgi:hypothetical protein
MMIKEYSAAWTVVYMHFFVGQGFTYVVGLLPLGYLSELFRFVLSWTGQASGW